MLAESRCPELKMKIALNQHGGLAAAVLRGRPARILDTDTLPAGPRQELLDLVEAARAEHGAQHARPAARRAPDAMSYVVTLEEDGQQTALRSSDAEMSDAFADLLAALKKHLR